jgi:hypothetical protein
MNEVAFWLSVAVSIGLVGAYFLPIVEAVYRLENRVATCSLPEPEKSERREDFEAQLALFLDRERRDGYRPVEIGWHLFVKMLTTLVTDIWDGAGPLLLRASWFFTSLSIRFRLWRIGRLLSRFDEKYRGPVGPQPAYRDTGVRFNLTAVHQTTPANDNEALRIRQSNRAMMDSAIQVIRQNVTWRNQAYRAAITSMGHRNSPLLDGPQEQPPTGRSRD